MKTKAELEAEINDLKVRVAQLEGAVSAYEFALSHLNQPQTYLPATQESWPSGPFPTWQITS